MNAPKAPIEAVLRRDRWVISGGLLFLTTLCWAYLVWDSSHMMSRSAAELSVSSLSQPDLRPWRAADGIMVFLMWSIMMVGMMVPSASPMLLVFAAVQRRRRARQQPYVFSGVFLLGYLSVWTLYSLLVTLAQWGLHSLAVLSPMMVTSSPRIAGGILILAGVFQWLPLKDTCLKHCRSPQSFIVTHWKEGTRNAFRMGVEHGSFCVGCCWVLMLVLFVTGVMNLLWIAILTILVLTEKLLPSSFGPWFSRGVGIILMFWGGNLLV